MTFGTHKVGLLVDPAAAAAGSVELVDIGLAPYLGEPALEALQEDDVRRLLPSPHGRRRSTPAAWSASGPGSAQYTGAGVLAVGAAVRSGLAGMVRYEGASEDLVRARFPEVVIGAGRVQAWVVGSGLGDEAREVLAEALGHRLPTVIDADALACLPARLGSPAVLTPHAGELAAMLGRPREEVEAQPLVSARTAAERWNAVVLLKGARSVIAAPDGRARVNTTGVPWLATAGAGDVLSGPHRCAARGRPVAVRRCGGGRVRARGRGDAGLRRCTHHRRRPARDPCGGCRLTARLRCVDGSWLFGQLGRPVRSGCRLRCTRRRVGHNVSSAVTCRRGSHD